MLKPKFSLEINFHSCEAFCAENIPQSSFRKSHSENIWNKREEAGGGWVMVSMYSAWKFLMGNGMKSAALQFLQ